MVRATAHSMHLKRDLGDVGGGEGGGRGGGYLGSTHRRLSLSVSSTPEPHTAWCGSHVTSM